MLAVPDGGDGPAIGAGVADTPEGVVRGRNVVDPDAWIAERFVCRG